MFRVGLFDRMRHVLAIVSVALLVACGDQPPTAPVTDRGSDAADFLSLTRPKLLECEPTEFATQTVEIGPAGGTISLGGVSVEFPLGALLNTTNVTVTIPASRFVEVDITTDGQRTFLDPLLRPIVTISYARCDRSDLLLKLLSAWYIDSDTKALLEKQLSFDNKLTKSVTFRARHFSGYAIAF